VTVLELVIGSIAFLFGIRSLLRWLGTDFQTTSTSERLLFTALVAARVGFWFAFAGFFVGYSLVDDPKAWLIWFFFVLIGLAAIQFLTSVLLLRSPTGRPTRPDRDGFLTTTVRSGESFGLMGETAHPVGPLEPEKHGETAEPGQPQPEAAEVESARLLANQARDALRPQGMTDEQIRKLADEFVALDRGTDLNDFVGWAKEEGRSRL
jgi:hypothetical protein